MPPTKGQGLQNEPGSHFRERGSRFGFARKLFLLYLGVLATAVEESYDFLSRLPERFEMAEQEGRKRVG